MNNNDPNAPWTPEQLNQVLPPPPNLEVECWKFKCAQLEQRIEKAIRVLQGKEDD